MTDHAAPLAVGLPDRFQILRQVGKGGMGIVYEAIDRHRGTRLALKTLQQMEPMSLYRFKREFRSLADLAHPNLVPLYELISDGTAWFFTMEFVEGQDFISYCRKGPRSRGAESLIADTRTRATGTLDGARHARLRAVLLQLVEGVGALHRAHIVHRDLKPSNVLVRDDGHLVILDFGVIKEIRSEDLATGGDRFPPLAPPPNHEPSWTGDQDVVGSVLYMSPEQASSGAVDGAADWYSVGVMLFEALTGSVPFSGSLTKVLTRKRLEDPPAARLIAPDVPDDLNDLCVELLRRDPQARPSGDAIRSRLLARPAPASGTWAPPAAFVGRHAQVAALTAAYERLEQNTTVAVHVRGRSGVGKTALAQRYLATLPAHAMVLTGRCYEQESVPYKALDSIVDDLCRQLIRLTHTEAQAVIPADIAALARIFPVLERVDAVREACLGRAAIPDPREVRRRAFGALAELLHRLGARRPLVLAIDDLQWGDEDSAAMLLHVLEAPIPPRLMLIACYRSEYAETSPCLAALNASRNRVAWVDVEVSELSLDEGAELASILLGGPSDPQVIARISRESGGSPFFIHELVSQLRRGRTTAAEAVHAAAALDLDEALRRRVLELQAPAQRMLELVAVAGKPLSLRHALDALDLGLQAASALAALRAERLIRSTGPGLEHEVETYHDRIRESVSRHIDPAALQDLHRRLALVFEAAGDVDVEATAVHFRLAGLADRAAHYYVLAGDKAAAALAFGRSADLYGVALDIGSATGAERRLLLRKRADAMANAGRGYDAAVEYQRAAEGASPAEIIDLQRRAGYQYCVSGHVDEGRHAFSTVLATFDMKLPRTRRQALLSLLMRRVQLRLRGLRVQERREADVDRAQLEQVDVLWSVSAGMTIVDPIRGADFQTLDLILALRAGEPYRIARALAWDAAHLAMRGGRVMKRVHAQLAAADELAERIQNRHAIGMVRMSQGVAAYFLGDFARCRQRCEEAVAIFREGCTGVSWELDTCNAFALWPSYFAGDYADLSRRFYTLITDVRDRGARLAEADLTAFGGLFVWLADDDVEGARRALRSVMGEWSRQDFQVQHFMTLTAETQIDMYAGDPASAWLRVRQQWAGVADAMLLHVEIVRVYMQHLRARCALAAVEAGGDRQQLLRWAEADARRLERGRPPYARALARPVRAALAYARGETADAARLLHAGADELDALGWGAFGAGARRQYGRLVGGERGRAIVEAVDARLLAQGVKRPDRLARLQAPGFGEA